MLIQFSTSTSSSIIPPSDDSKTPPSLTQPRPYLTSRTPRNPHADAHHALAFPAVCIPQTDVQFPLLRLFTELERRQASDLDGVRLEMTWMGMESHHRVADFIIPSEISSSCSGFAVRTDWRSSDPSTVRRHPTSPSSSPSLMPKSNWSS
jgi:hypothetical protein